jgi:hypothetical protein
MSNGLLTHTPVIFPIHSGVELFAAGALSSIPFHSILLAYSDQLLNVDAP